MPHIRDVKDKLRVGQKVRTNGSYFRRQPDWIEGVIGEINGDTVYVWSNTANGTVGKLKPASYYKYSWAVRKEGDFEIEIGGNMKKIWEVIVVDKTKDEIIVREIVIDGDEKSACSKVSIRFSDKLKDMIFDNLCYITKELGSYEEKKG